MMDYFQKRWVQGHATRLFFVNKWQYLGNGTR